MIVIFFITIRIPIFYAVAYLAFCRHWPEFHSRFLGTVLKRVAKGKMFEMPNQKFIYRVNIIRSLRLFDDFIFLNRNILDNTMSKDFINKIEIKNRSSMFVDDVVWAGKKYTGFRRKTWKGELERNK